MATSVGMYVTAWTDTLVLLGNRWGITSAKLNMPDYDGDGDKMATGWRAWTLSNFHFMATIAVTNTLIFVSLVFQ